MRILLFIWLLGIAFADSHLDEDECGGICEDLTEYLDSNMFAIADDQNFKVDLVLASGLTDRVGVKNAPIIVHITSKGRNTESPADDVSELRLTYTNDEGVAQFDFEDYNDMCHEYKFMFCYSSGACGIEKCLNTIGLNPLVTGVSGLNDITLANDVSVPADAQDPAKVRSAFASYKYCPPPPPIGASTPAFCLPLVLIFSLLMGALHLSGKNPFGMFDFSAPRLGKHFRYVARGRGFGFDVGSIAAGLIKAATMTTKSGRATLENKERQEEKQAGGAWARTVSAAGYGGILKSLKGMSEDWQKSPERKAKDEQAFKFTDIFKSSAAVSSILDLGKVAEKEKGALATTFAVGLAILERSSFGGIVDAIKSAREAIKISATIAEAIENMKNHREVIQLNYDEKTGVGQEAELTIKEKKDKDGKVVGYEVEVRIYSVEAESKQAFDARVQGAERQYNQSVATASEARDETKQEAEKKRDETIDQAKQDLAKGKITQAEYDKIVVAAHQEYSDTVRQADQTYSSAVGTAQNVRTEQRQAAQQEYDASDKSKTRRTDNGTAVQDFNSLSADQQAKLKPALENALGVINDAARSIQYHTYQKVLELEDKKKEELEALAATLSVEKLEKEKEKLAETDKKKAEELQKLIDVLNEFTKASDDLANGHITEDEFKSKKLEIADSAIILLSNDKNDALLDRLGASAGKNKELLEIRKEAIATRVVEQQAIAANLMYESTDKTLKDLDRLGGISLPFIGAIGEEKVNLNSVKAMADNAANAMLNAAAMQGIEGALLSPKLSSKDFDALQGKLGESFRSVELSMTQLAAQSEIFSVNPALDLKKIDLTDAMRQCAGEQARELYRGIALVAQNGPGDDKERAKNIGELVAQVSTMLKEDPGRAGEVAIFMKALGTSQTDGSSDKLNDMQDLWRQYVGAKPEDRTSIAAKAVWLDGSSNVENGIQAAFLDKIPADKVAELADRLADQLEKRAENNSELQGVVDRLRSSFSQQQLPGLLATYADRVDVDKFLRENLPPAAKAEYEGTTKQFENFEQKSLQVTEIYKAGLLPGMSSLMGQLGLESKPPNPLDAGAKLFFKQVEVEGTKVPIPNPEYDKVLPFARSFGSNLLKPSDPYRYQEPNFSPSAGGMRYNPVTGRMEYYQ